VFASAVYALERLFDIFKNEVNTTLDAAIPHRSKWYRDKALAFMVDKLLINDTDNYDVSEMTDSEISAAKIVKYAAAVENADSSILIIKVAGENNGVRSALSTDEETQLLAYLQEVKDAGVRISLVNQTADTFNCEVDIKYNAMLLPDIVKADVNSAIVSYIENLTFNGEYSNMSLVDAIQLVEGAEIVEFKWAKSCDANSTVFEAIDATKVPTAGYFKAGDITINMKAHAVV
jgi:hypothetical protein